MESPWKMRCLMEKEAKEQQCTRHKIKEATLEVNPPVPTTSAGAKHRRDELPSQALSKFLTHKILSKVK